MVAGENHHIIRVVQVHKTDILIDGVGCPLIPRTAFAALVRWQDVDTAGGAIQIPRYAAADVTVEFQRAVLRQHAHRVNAGVAAVGERKVNDAVLTAEGHGGLGHGAGQHIQAAALSACQQHGNTLFFHVSTSFACFFALGLGKTPSPRRNTAPKAGMRIAAECSFPWEGIASTRTAAVSPKPSPP